MLKNKVISPSSSDWASCPVLVRKKDGKVRWCVDYRKLNSVTVKDCFPLPKIEECLDNLAGNTLFSTLDMNSGYWQLNLDEQDKHKTAFITKYGLYEHTRLPFGLCNSPATFSRAIQLVLRGLAWSIVLAYLYYLYDVVILEKDFDTLMNNLDIVFERFREHNLKSKPRKCTLFQTEIQFLGRGINCDGLYILPDHIQKILVSLPNHYH